MAAKGQSVRDKFFLDFVAGATQLADPFGKERNTGSKNIDWLPQLRFEEVANSAENDVQESVDELRALFATVNVNTNLK
jgi:hypothetical protein